MGGFLSPNISTAKFRPISIWPKARFYKLRLPKLKLRLILFMANHLADILFLLGTAHHAEAESWLNEAILSHEQLRINWDLVRDHRLMAQLLAVDESGGKGVRLFQQGPGSFQ